MGVKQVADEERLDAQRELKPKQCQPVRTISVAVVVLCSFHHFYYHVFLVTLKTQYSEMKYFIMLLTP